MPDEERRSSWTAFQRKLDTRGCRAHYRMADVAAMEIDEPQPQKLTAAQKGKSKTGASQVLKGGPWVEKYRPTSLADVAAHKDIIDTSTLVCRTEKQSVKRSDDAENFVHTFYYCFLFDLHIISHNSQLLESKFGESVIRGTKCVSFLTSFPRE